MYFSSLVLLAPFLPSLVTADQVPLREKAAGWLDKAKSYIPNSGPVDVVEAGAAHVAEQRVERINIRNWQRKLSPKLDTEEEWLVYVTGGNKSCFGRCGHADSTWNVSLSVSLSISVLSNQYLALAGGPSVCPSASGLIKTSTSGYSRL
jgi:hypothetical protein